MNLYLVERTDDVNYEEYESFVAACSGPDKARSLRPSDAHSHYETWPVDDVLTLQVTLIGKARRGLTGVIHTSFRSA